MLPINEDFFKGSLFISTFFKSSEKKKRQEKTREKNEK